ncbi:UPF0481 protein At3g47200-like isoform X1 [Camellia sinensis]|uniref:Uncharacterized protein n=2 Tax=Camellia sinensis TaxID=4442 RepID=A0A4S4EJP4_CAMSN|nr:UPF0481 protein At3g47200-like isoform X1 [Camellia sinensis]XP_028065799.1 UPF0481 protein At3g47200-like isoform X1 [Camellia sinensis]XP_028065800.1 UPF0481 protein At3g47200-like isoform X1 [Camellia sinensis]THG16156.1 hypothetical protein TEA_014467 [Camellia sinensis var. sinensis]
MLSNATVDPVSLHLDEKLTRLSSTDSECYIYKVHDRLRWQNEKLYEPEILAIGPYHHGKDNLQWMEEHKLGYLRLLLKRRNETSVDRYIVAMRDLQEQALRCYANSIWLNKDEFVKMMLLDSCFLVELFRKFTITSMRDRNDSLFKIDWILPSILRDLFLFENQLPFFVLVQLFDMTKLLDPHDNITDLAIRYCHSVSQYLCYSASLGLEKILYACNGISTCRVKHFLGLTHQIASFSLSKSIPLTNVIADKKKIWEHIHCATELHEVGIKFKKCKHDTFMCNVKFKNGVLEIPTFVIHEKTECLLRNVIAYEQHHLEEDIGLKYTTDYLTLLCCLINSSQDVSLLRRCGILENMLGGDEAVVSILNKISTCAITPHDNFYYSQVFNDISGYSKQRWNVWTAMLRRNYFNSPWTIISFLGAIMLLLLTLTQTMFSILAYFCNRGC